MTRDSSADDASGDQGSPQPDAHGQAAMLLVESLIHGLIARSVISVADAIEIVEGAAEVEAEIEADRKTSQAPPRSSITLLEAISRSLKPDVETP